MAKFFKRTKFITHFRHQVGLALVFMSWSAVLVCILIGLFFINYASIRTDTGALTIHDQLLARMLLVDQAKQLALSYGIAMLVFLVLVGLYVMAYAHRMTGPIHKLNLILKKSTEEKSWPKHLSFRKHDAFHDLAKNFNHFIDAMKDKK